MNRSLTLTILLSVSALAALTPLVAPIFSAHATPTRPAKQSGPSTTTTTAMPAILPAIDPVAVALLKKAEDNMFALQTYQADCWTVQTQERQPGDASPARVSYQGSTLVAAKLAQMRYELRMRGQGTPAEVASIAKQFVRVGRVVRTSQTPQSNRVTTVSDGKTLWRQNNGAYLVDTRYIEPEELGTLLEPWGGFYSKTASPFSALQRHLQAKSEQAPGTGTTVLEVRSAGRKTVEGSVCDTVFIRTRTVIGRDAKEYQQTWCISVGDSLVHRLTERIVPRGKAGSVREATLYNVRLNTPIASPEKTFAYVAPPGVKKFVRAAPPPLLAAGFLAPDFVAQDTNNQPVKLSAYQGKVVVVDFWASWCAPCIASMPHTQEVISKLQKEGVPVVLLAVDDAEERAAFTKWVAKHEGEYNALTFIHAAPKASPSISKSYQVSGIPTQYVIDASGVVRASFVGYGGPTDDLENAVRAAIGATSRTPTL